MAYKFRKPTKTTIEVNQEYIGERIEDKVTRITANREPIKDTAPQIYTERKDGVIPAYDIRTDRFEHAIEAMDKVSQHYQAKRADRLAKVVPIKKDEAGQSGDGKG